MQSSVHTFQKWISCMNKNYLVFVFGSSFEKKPRFSGYRQKLAFLNHVVIIDMMNWRSAEITKKFSRVVIRNCVSLLQQYSWLWVETSFKFGGLFVVENIQILSTLKVHFSFILRVGCSVFVCLLVSFASWVWKLFDYSYRIIVSHIHTHTPTDRKGMNPSIQTCDYHAGFHVTALGFFQMNSYTYIIAVHKK